MKAPEAAALTARLKGLFRKLTVSEQDYWADQFLAHASEAVSGAIDDYARLNSDYVDRPNLIRMIEDRERDPAARRRQQALEMEERRREQQAEAEKARIGQSEIDKRLKDFTDDDLADLKETVLAQSPHLNDGARKMLRVSDPKSGKALRWAMAAYLKQSAEVSQ